MATTVVHAQSAAVGGAQLVTKHAVGSGHMSPEDMGTTFSPLSSSTITIVSLGSSLAFGVAAESSTKGQVEQRGAALSMVTGPDAFDSDGDNASDSDAGCNTDSSYTTAAGRGGLAQGAGALVTRFDSAVGGADAHRAPRSVSLDVSRARGMLHILHTGTAAAAAVASSSPSIAEDKAAPAKGTDAPKQSVDTARPSVDTAVGPGAPHPNRRSLAKRLLRPLSWRPSAAATAAIAAQVGASTEPAAVDASRRISSSTETYAATAATSDAAPSQSLEIKHTEALLSRTLVKRRAAAAAGAQVLTAGDAKDDSAVGPVRFQALSRSLGARLGLSSVVAERRRQAGDLRFVLAPHPMRPEVVEVYDCDEMAPVYRKVSRSGKSWHETFHEIDEDDEDELAACLAANGIPSPLALPYPVLGLNQGYSSPVSCVSLGSSSSAAAAAAGPGTVQMGQARTSAGYTLAPGRQSMAPSTYGSPGSVPADSGMLWEARTPFPNQFPLHVKDARKLIDTVSMASMVLDRHDFCYRFQLGHARMRWVAKRARRHQLALHCFVRSTLVAEIFVDYEKGYSPYSMLAATAAQHMAAYGTSSSSSGMSTPLEPPGPAVELPAAMPEDGSLPVVTILPALFAQLPSVDPGVAESFAIFTGMQALECLHI